ncbi:hypothetical protein ADP72_20330 [Serratia plymuthica]|nr:hypothetical protein ADP72_20330 [Serratia plymuthica]
MPEFCFWMEQDFGSGSDSVFVANLPGRNPAFGLAEDTDDLFVGKTFLHWNVVTLLMKTLLTSRCINQ